MQVGEFSKVCVGSVITCFIPYKDVKSSNWAPSAVVVSLDYKLLDLALKSPIINIKCGLDMLTTSFSKLVVKELRSLDV